MDSNGITKARLVLSSWVGFFLSGKQGYYMFHKNVVLGVVGLAALMVSVGANAALVSADDGFAVYDSQTGTYWMNLMETVNLPLSELEAEMEAGGKYEGWGFASKEDVHELWSLNVDSYDANKGEKSYIVGSAERDEWASYFGSSDHVAYLNMSTGFYYDEPVNQWRLGGFYRENYPSSGDIIFHTEKFTTTYNSYVVKGHTYGHYMVYSGTLSLDDSAASVEDVPLPLWGMGALGLLGLGFGRKSKKA